MFGRKVEINNVVTTPLRAEHGDTLIIQSERRLSKDVMTKLQQQLAKELPGQRIIVLEAGLKLTGAVGGESDA